MAAKSNTANGGLTYFTIDIEKVSNTATQYVLRVRVRLTSPNVIDTVNRFYITGGTWSRDTSHPLSGIYDNDVVWTSSNVTVDRPAKTASSGKTVSVRLRWYNVEFWNTTLDATDTYTVPKQAETAPSKPGTPSVSDITTNSAKLSWSAPSDPGSNEGISEYQLRVSTSSSFSSSTAISTGTKKSHTVTGLAPNTTYYAKVRAKNNVGWGDYSNTRTFTTAIAAPSAPGTPSVTSTTSSSIGLSWTAPSNTGGGSIQQYQVQRAKNSAFTDSASTATIGNVRSHTSTGLTRATTYFFRVRAQTAGGWGPYSGTRQASTPPVPPTLANGATHSSVSGTSAIIGTGSISDNGGQGATNFRVQWNTSATESGASTLTKGSWGSVQLTGLSEGTTYYYRRSAANSAGWGAWTSWESFTTLAGVINDLELTVVDMLPAGWELSWTQPELNGATLLNYEWGVSINSGPWGPTYTTSNLGLSVSDLALDVPSAAPGTVFEVRVRARATDESLSSGWSYATLVVPLPPPSEGPTAHLLVGGVPVSGTLWIGGPGGTAIPVKDIAVGTL